MRRLCPLLSGPRLRRPVWPKGGGSDGWCERATLLQCTPCIYWSGTLITSCRVVARRAICHRCLSLSLSLLPPLQLLSRLKLLLLCDYKFLCNDCVDAETAEATHTHNHTRSSSRDFSGWGQMLDRNSFSVTSLPPAALFQPSFVSRESGRTTTSKVKLWKEAYLALCLEPPCKTRGFKPPVMSLIRLPWM